MLFTLHREVDYLIDPTLFIADEVIIPALIPATHSNAGKSLESLYDVSDDPAFKLIYLGLRGSYRHLMHRDAELSIFHAFSETGAKKNFRTLWPQYKEMSRVSLVYDSPNSSELTYVENLLSEYMYPKERVSSYAHLIVTSQQYAEKHMRKDSFVVVPDKQLPMFSNLENYLTSVRLSTPTQIYRKIHPID